MYSFAFAWLQGILAAAIACVLLAAGVPARKCGPVCDRLHLQKLLPDCGCVCPLLNGLWCLEGVQLGFHCCSQCCAVGWYSLSVVSAVKSSVTSSWC